MAEICEDTKVHADAAALKAAHEEAESQLPAITTLLAQPLLGSFIDNYAPNLVDEIASQEATSGDRPFLSIVTRTQGSRIETLRDVLMCLAGQSCQDFELLIVVHSVIGSAREAVHALVAEVPAALQNRIRVTTCTRASRAAPLNDALSDVKGQYVAVLDDDDLVLGHWVETFQKLAREAPGAMLRATCARQEVEMIPLGELRGCPRATSWFKMDFPAIYDAVAHLCDNHTPFMSIAFPAALFRDLELRFDEGLSTIEDWDFISRAGMLCGVATSADVTSIYRWWTNAETSYSLHGREEWDVNREHLIQKLDSQPILLPPGSVARINMLNKEKRALETDRVQLTEQVGELDRARSQLAERYEWMATKLIGAGISLPWPDPDDRLNELRILVDLVNSTSWRCTRPLRKIVNVLRGQPGCGLTLDEIPSTLEHSQRLIQELRTSTSWQLTRPLRSVGRIIRQFGTR